jgi:organic hydroperoxide reductase OsmC/OhrA
MEDFKLNSMTYKVLATKIEGHACILSSETTDKTVTVVTAAPFINSIENEWSSGHLFLGSLATCLATNFFAVARNSKFEFLDFSCTVTAELNWKDGKFSFSELLLTPTLLIEKPTQRSKALRMLKMALSVCSIFNSLSIEVKLTPDIVVFKRKIYKS